MDTYQQSESQPTQTVGNTSPNHQDTNGPKQNKTIFWKAGIVIWSYVLATFLGAIVGFILQIILDYLIHGQFTIFAGSGNTILNYALEIFVRIAGLFGIYSGLRSVAKKTYLYKSDVYKMLAGFVILNLVFSFRGMGEGNYAKFILTILFLAIYGLVIVLLSKKLVDSSD